MSSIKVSEIPAATLEPGWPLFRIHRAAYDPIHFSASDAGRWDPPVLARSEYGTCYFAESPLGAYLEVFARTIPIRESLVLERVLSEIQVSRPVRIADLAHPSMAGRVGAIPEISVGPSYTESQQLSAALRDEGFEGVCHLARHDPTGRSRSTAIFSDASVAIGVIKTTAIPEYVIATAEAEYELFMVPDAPLF